MVPLTGYADRVSGEAGDRIAFKVSSLAAGPCTASLVRIILTPIPSAGPGMKIEDLLSASTTTFEAREQKIEMGSYVRVDGATALSPLGAMTISVLVFPTLPDAGDQCVTARWDADTATGFTLLATADGFAAEIGRIGAPTLRVATGRKLRSRAWYRVWLIIDPAARSVRLGQKPLRAEAGWDDFQAMPGRRSTRLSLTTRAAPSSSARNRRGPRCATSTAASRIRSSSPARIRRSPNSGSIRRARHSARSPPGISRAASTRSTSRTSAPTTCTARW